MQMQNQPNEREVRLYFERQHEQLVRDILKNSDGYVRFLSGPELYRPDKSQAVLTATSDLDLSRKFAFAEKGMQALLGKLETHRGANETPEDPGTDYVMIDGHSFYREGIVFSPRDEIVHYVVYKDKSSESRRRRHRVGMIRIHDDVVLDAFPTYYERFGIEGANVPKPPLVLYRTKQNRG